MLPGHNFNVINLTIFKEDTLFSSVDWWVTVRELWVVGDQPSGCRCGRKKQAAWLSSLCERLMKRVLSWTDWGDVWDGSLRNYHRWGQWRRREVTETDGSRQLHLHFIWKKKPDPKQKYNTIFLPIESFRICPIGSWMNLEWNYSSRRQFV